MGRVGRILLAAAAAALLLASAVAAHGPGTIEVDVARSADSRFKDEIHVEQGTGERRRYPLRIRNEFDNRRDVVIRPGFGPAYPSSIKVIYLDRDGDNVTSQVNAPPDHYTFSLGAGKTRKMIIAIKTSAPDNGCVPTDGVADGSGSTATIHLNGPCDLPG